MPTFLRETQTVSNRAARPVVRLALASVLLGLLIAGAGHAQDFGDAPDGAPTGYPAGFAQSGRFPTLLSSNGARALSGQGARLGTDISMEPDALPGGDADDGLTDLVIQLVSIPPPARMGLVVYLPPGSTGGTWYVNALIDMNMDGTWGGTTETGLQEWAVQNQPLTLAPGTSVPLVTPFFLFGNGNRLPSRAWMRLAVTPVPVPSGWSGAGEFAAGEIEDHLIELPADIRTGEAKPIPVIACPPGQFFFRGRQQLDFQCSVTNIGGPLVPPAVFAWTLTRLAGGVTIFERPGACAGAARVGGAVPPPALPAAINLTACRGQPLPSRWAATVTADDPPSVLTSRGIVIGHGDSLVPLHFDEAPPGTEPPPQQQPPRQQQRRQEKPRAN